MTTSPIDISGCDGKEAIRQRVWNYMEQCDIARFPRPVHNRIPNFVDSDAACNRLLQLEQFHHAKLVKINPDKAQQRARYLTLAHDKTLLVPTPRLRTGLFNRIEPPRRDHEMLQLCSSKEGISRYSTPIGLEDRLAPELIIVGSVALDMFGRRIGKGEGYADLEFGMLCTMNGYNPDRCTIISVVHDCQLFPYLDPALFAPHDFRVDIILTPSQTIICEKDGAQQQPGILWDLLSEQKLSEIPILRKLKQIQNVRL